MLQTQSPTEEPQHKTWRSYVINREAIWRSWVSEQTLNTQTGSPSSDLHLDLSGSIRF